MTYKLIDVLKNLTLNYLSYKYYFKPQITLLLLIEMIRDSVANESTDISELVLS